MESLPGFYRELMFSRFLFSQINVCHEFYIEMLAYSMTVTKESSLGNQVLTLSSAALSGFEKVTVSLGMVNQRSMVGGIGGALGSGRVACWPLPPIWTPSLSILRHPARGLTEVISNVAPTLD